MNQANYFRSLHIAGKPLVLYNIWDAGGASALADAGAKAIATGSWSVAAAHGFADGEGIPLDFVLQIMSQIAQAVDLPLTVDFEGGYAKDPATVTNNVQRLIATGAVGLNFEDQIVGGEGLYDIDDQAARVRAVRMAAEREAVPLFINARTDLFLKSDASTHQSLCDQAIARAAAYTDAGADGFFVPGLTDHALITRICQETNLPVNVMMTGPLQSISELAALGVSRISFGPAPYLRAMKDIATQFQALR